MTRPHSLTYFTGIACTFLLLLSSCKEKTPAGRKEKSPDQAPIVDVMVASLRPISNRIEANGSVVANEYAELHPEISGRIVYLNVPEGAQVTTGTIIARINDA